MGNGKASAAAAAEKQNKQVATQRFSYADPMSDGTLRGIANPDYQRSTENFYENSSSKQQRPQDLPVFTVSGPKVAFNSEPPGESSTDAIGSYWLDQQDNQTSGFLSSRPRLILAAIILLLNSASCHPILVSNRQYQQSLQAAAAARNADNRRREASGTRRETENGVRVLTATSPDSLPRGVGNDVRGSQHGLASAQAPVPATALMQSDVCLQYAGIGDSPTAGLEGSTDCLYLDLATPAEKPGATCQQ
uniref:COesterase domain-containing protein n=1 Tax=Macrostomum lignano TaxID=282301 RepID=A0A1I8F4R4_9PLAT